MSRRGGTGEHPSGRRRARYANWQPGKHEADSPAQGTRATPSMAAWPASTLTIFRLPLFGSGVKAAFGVRGTVAVHARKGTFSWVPQNCFGLVTEK